MTTSPKQQKSAIPLIGFGTYKITGRACVDSVKRAWDLGYRHFDTADVYGNHREVGEGLREKPRSSLFIVSKLFTNNLTSTAVATAVPRIIDELQLGPLDLLLIHWPNPAVAVSETLEAMLRCRDDGLVKAVGVSNFVRFHLEEMKPYLADIVTNQVELHPYLQRRKLRDAYEKALIPLTAYRPLGRGAFEDDKVLSAIGKKYGKSPSQISLRWLVQNGIAAIPKAASPEHMKANIDLFDFSLDESDLAAIETLDQGIRYCAPDSLPVYDD